MKTEGPARGSSLPAAYLAGGRAALGTGGLKQAADQTIPREVFCRVFPAAMGLFCEETAAADHHAVALSALCWLECEQKGMLLIGESRAGYFGCEQF